ncbi:MAG: M1 family aminopeptidase [Sphingobacteriales bacterium]|nr:M1 family aminopeptidase [Sphingobacteriales bacterium]
MKGVFISILLCFQVFVTNAQEIDNCAQKCNRVITDFSTSRVSYYQETSMNKYDVKYLKLDISAQPGSRVISGNALTIAQIVSPLDTFITELRSNMIVDSIKINNVITGFSQSSDHIFMPLSTTQTVGSSISVLIFYHGTSNSLGVYAGTSSGLTYVATLSESYQAREWFPCKQILSDKIDSADIWVTTSNVNKVGSNGLLQGVDVLPSSKVRYRWKTTYPMNYYMPSIAVGNYQEYLNYAKPAAMAPDSILVQHYIVNTPTYLSTVKTNLDKTPTFIEKMSELFGLYPFKNEKYGHSMANIGGGMEHQTMSTMVSFGSTLIAHELGHQWWGDHVTCASWNDIWLNEGFATYSEQLMIEKLPALFTTSAATNMLNLHNSVMSATNGSVYVPDASLFDENRIFSSRLSYNKGATTVHNLRFEMQSDTLFFKTLKNFQQQYKNNVATTSNFKAVAENTSGKNLTDFFNQWIYGEGYPTYNITYYNPNSDTMLLLVNETVSAPTVTPFFKGLLELKITSLQGDTTVLVNVTGNNQVFKIGYNKTPNGIVIDPNNWIVNKTGTVTSGVVLPVRLISFTGTATADCMMNLNWKTADEFNVTKYEIEVSSNGMNFVKIGEQIALLNTTNDYQFSVQDNIHSFSYFRIKIVESDGSYSYTSTVNLETKCPLDFGVEFSPVPFQNNLNIRIQLGMPTEFVLVLTNSVGQIIKKEKRSLVRGINNINWSNMNQLAAGTYIISVTDQFGNKTVKKLIKN